jgi:hypothetical protein
MKKRVFLIALFVMVAAALIYLINENIKLNREISDMKELHRALVAQSKYREDLINKFEAENILLRSKATSVRGSDTVGSGTINTRINGDFNGWSGTTIFYMTDGTAWQQAEHNVYYFNAYMPPVTIVNRDGRYYMRVGNADREIMVKRVK